ncbi:MAG: VOC family protein [Alphaproteobacteria bacterium]|nr:VOC family protein [Alphaproteobacteria bacterium]
MDNKPAVTVRYIVNDVPAALAFYTEHLGFTVHQDTSPAFAALDRGPMRLLISNKTSAGAKAMPDGRAQEPGGWSRFQIHVADLKAEVERLEKAGCKFRNEIIEGKGGAGILLDDPSGNVIELYQPAAH